MVATVDISPREAEVLELVGDHLSNAEIAARLFISVRTAESHVSALLRKLDVPDRRALAARAAAGRRAAGASQPVPVLPAPLTSFVGRAGERAELNELIEKHRQVTAVGPGGVGKTRLALAVAADAAGAFADGAWFVDLVPVTDPGMVADAVAGALGLGEQPGRGMAESVAAALADRHALLVLDNCEQVRDGVALFLERLLAACPRVTALTTSRARLMVPFERVYAVPPLSLSDDGESDAVALFKERATAIGWPLDPPLHEHIRSICERLDGMALAIELAAARYPTLGLDGLTAALSHPLRTLAGGSRADDRHRSVRAAVDWSHALLEPADRELLRRVSVFVAPFTAAAAAEVAGAEEGVAADGLARLAEQSLLVVRASGGATEYRALETIRQYGVERLAESGELADTRTRHLRWCLARAADLAAATGADWRPRFDGAADDLRSALAWAADRPERRADAHDLARRLAELAFTRNLVGESQQRYEQAAALAGDPAGAAAMLRHAAAVAGCRMHGDDMYRLHRAAADAARRAGDAARAAADLATAATAVYRFAGTFVRTPSPDETRALIREARDHAGDDPAARAAVALAEAASVADAFGADQDPRDEAVAETLARAGNAVELAHRTGVPSAESAALDALAAVQSWVGDAFATAATARRRVTLLSSARTSPAVTHELVQALGEAAQTGIGVGDLPDARRWAGRLADHPSLAEVGHRATSWQLVAGALAGDAGSVLTGAVRFLDAWRRSGSPVWPDLEPAVAAVAMIHGLRGDRDARHEWDTILERFGTSPNRVHGYGAVFDAMLLLHDGRAAQALERLAPEPGEVWRWVTWIWLHWYVALRAEATVLAGGPDARDRLAGARKLTAGDPVAGAMVERAEALLDGDPERLLATADAFDAAGCHYQSARTLLLAGGSHAARGATALKALGLAPMTVR
ncbi:putative ATPase/DNA-binding CsgD family transcriptional regulator [Actinomadura luteofluorescens]|uniref:Putative ATPase/DNA-binding CsgD family transcriptional regulator n=1 Tax=Actinomadura luteofluorescens TaxID=46163 RepID=A0A7Y9JIP2_9ACTN|nr:LuxR C-terminal-related transcriptional regulator [Actinomadura luteofluorescens]NYD50260.1 putative ATPase/DNA-binding CsgD family transcriptional regulator [Actinomadura luteofluorescens]